MSAINNRWNTGIGTCPCDTCPQSERCSDFTIACEDFAAYSYSNAYQETDRNPTRAQYERIYGREDEVA